MSYGQTQHPYQGSNSMPSTWPNFSGSNSFLHAGCPQPYGASFMPAHPPVNRSQVLQSNGDGWNYSQSVMGVQVPMQYPAIPHTSHQTYQYASHQPPSTSASDSYMTSSAQASSSYAPIARSSKRGPHRGGYNGSPQDAAHFE